MAATDRLERAAQLFSLSLGKEEFGGNVLGPVKQDRSRSQAILIEAEGASQVTDLSMTKAEQSEYDRLIFAAREASPAVTIGAHPCDETSLPGALVAAQNRLIIPVLAGTVAKIRATFLAHADAAGIVLGVRVPIVLTSRSHCVRSRLVSRAVATLCAASRRRVTELAA